MIRIIGKSASSGGNGARPAAGAAAPSCQQVQPAPQVQHQAGPLEIQLRTAIAERDRQISELQGQLTERDKTVEKQKTMIEEKDKEIAELHNEVRRQRLEINGLKPGKKMF